MEKTESRRDFYWKAGTVALLIAVVSALHYGTQTSLPLLHDVYRRLYYIPVGLAAVWLGVAGGLTASAAVALAYLPHIFLDWHHAHRELVNQLMEIGLYFLVSGVTGYFADRERRFRRSWQEAAENLERSYAELRRQADTMLEIETQLRRADRLAAVGQLAAGMTHEIRNPLGSIRGTAEILKDDFPPGHPKAEFLDILLRETDRLNQVVEDFLGFARQRGDEAEANRTDLGEAVRETIGLLAPQARRTHVTLRADPEPGVSVGGSAAQLKQVFLNLLLNAVQSAPSGSTVTVGVEIRTGRVQATGYRDVEGRVAALTVEDEGPGIQAEALPHLFEPFFTTKPEGTGLGLAISQRITEALGGTLTAENRPGGGARFTLLLPLAEGLEVPRG
jgi:two-component system sensor histidine kinase HydH